MPGRVGEVPEAVRRDLWRRSIGMCARCRRELDTGTRGPAPTANVAHIVASADGGARADPRVTPSDRNKIENLLLLCPTCHDVIDKDEDSHSTAVLLDLKSRHEMWCATLRQAGEKWNRTLSMVDFVNLPRMPLLAGGEVIEAAAREAELDPERPFRTQGMRAGLFVERVRECGVTG
jgi:hypothetical protein